MYPHRFLIHVCPITTSEPDYWTSTERGGGQEHDPVWYTQKLGVAAGMANPGSISKAEKTLANSYWFKKGRLSTTVSSCMSRNGAKEN